jgi:hypothetical protein
MSRDKIESAYSAFASVDALASKPILGSDGAANWQEFRTKNKDAVISKGTAPHAPLKKADRLGTGFQSVKEERSHEEKVREEGNEARMNSGYTTFKRKQNQGDIEEKKRRKMIEERIRPDKVKYFIAAITFEGWKEDYIFTTRERGTGYYWDGMDSLKKLRGEQCSNVVAGNTKVYAASIDTIDEDPKPKKKKKKSKKGKNEISHSSSHAPEEGAKTNNPMEQVLNAMRRRTEIVNRPPGSHSQDTQETKATLTGTKSSSTFGNVNSIIDMESLKSQLAMFNWEVANDPNSGKLYYFSRKSGERQWENPLANLKNGSVNNNEYSADCTLPYGWRSAQDSIGRTYYYNRESGKTSWEKPT